MSGKLTLSIYGALPSVHFTYIDETAAGFCYSLRNEIFCKLRSCVSPFCLYSVPAGQDVQERERLRKGVRSEDLNTLRGGGLPCGVLRAEHMVKAQTRALSRPSVHMRDGAHLAGQADLAHHSPVGGDGSVAYGRRHGAAYGKIGCRLVQVQPAGHVDIHVLVIQPDAKALFHDRKEQDHP